MRTGRVFDLLAFTMWWTLILSVVIFSAAYLAGGLAHFEAKTYGTDYFISQGDTNPIGHKLREHMEAKEQTEAMMR